MQTLKKPNAWLLAIQVWLIKVELSEPMNHNDSEIKRVARTKSLGVIVEERLNWDD